MRIVLGEPELHRGAAAIRRVDAGRVHNEEHGVAQAVRPEDDLTAQAFGDIAGRDGGRRCGREEGDRHQQRERGGCRRKGGGHQIGRRRRQGADGQGGDGGVDAQVFGGGGVDGRSGLRNEHGQRRGGGHPRRQRSRRPLQRDARGLGNGLGYRSGRVGRRGRVGHDDKCGGRRSGDQVGRRGGIGAGGQGDGGGIEGLSRRLGIVSRRGRGGDDGRQPSEQTRGVRRSGIGRSWRGGDEVGRGGGGGANLGSLGRGLLDDGGGGQDVLGRGGAGNDDKVPGGQRRRGGKGRPGDDQQGGAGAEGRRAIAGVPGEEVVAAGFGAIQAEGDGGLAVDQRLLEQAELVNAQHELVGGLRRQAGLVQGRQDGLQHGGVVDVLEALAAPIGVDLRIEPAHFPDAAACAVQALVV